MSDREMIGFKNTYYDRTTDNLYIWGYDSDGKNVNIKTKALSDYFVVDPTGTSDIKDIFGTPYIIQEVRDYQFMKKLLKSGKMKTCEATLDPEVKWLHRNFGNKYIKFDLGNYNIATLDIELEIGDNPKPIDETISNCDSVINLISIHFSKTDTIYTFGNQPYTGDYGKIHSNWTYYYIPDEKRLLEAFISIFRKNKVDIITGWNCLTFDMRYIIDRAIKLGVNKSLSPINIYQKKTMKDAFDNEVSYYDIAGVSILDGMLLYKNFTFKQQVSYSLNYIGQKEVKEGKLDLDSSINTAYKDNWNLFVDYNIQDVILVKKINDKKQFINLAINLSNESCIPVGGVFSSIKVITGYILKYFHMYNLVLPDRDRVEKEKFPGAFVKANRGIYQQLVSYDFASLYPTIIRMFNISPETLVFNPSEEEIPHLIKTPASLEYKCTTPSGPFSTSGIYYRKEQGVLPKIIEKIYNERVYFKDKMKVTKGMEKSYSVDDIATNNHFDLEYTKQLYAEIELEGYDSTFYDSQQQIRKILMNSMYGVLGNPHFSMSETKNAMAITIAGRDVIEYVSNAINNYFKNYWNKVIHKRLPQYSHITPKPITGDLVPVIDTDSNFFHIGKVIESLGLTFDTDEEFRLWVDMFDQKIMVPFFKRLLDDYATKYNTVNLHKFKREKIIINKMVLKKKKYADLVIENEGDVFLEPDLKVTGIDMVKTSTATLFKEALEETLLLMMKTNDKEQTRLLLCDYRDRFLDANVSDIAFHRSINNYSKYAYSPDQMIEDGGVYFQKGTVTPQHVRASARYNYLVKKRGLVLPYITNGSKVNVVYVDKNNILQTEYIAFVGQYPKDFEDIFKIDYSLQWYKGFIKLISEFYDVFGWGGVDLNSYNIGNFLEF